jgi:hypothetical protein
MGTGAVSRDSKLCWPAALPDTVYWKASQSLKNKAVQHAWLEVQAEFVEVARRMCAAA